MKPFPDPAESMSAGSNSSPAQPFIVFRCPNCGKRIGFPPKMANTVAVCSACKARLMVPSKADEESFLVCDGPSAKPPVPQASRLVARHEPAARSEWPNRRSSVLVLAAACVALAGLAIPLSLASRGKPVAQRGDKGGKTVAPAASNPSATASSPHVPDTQAVAAPAPTAEPQKPPALRTVAVPAAPAGEPDAALRTAAVPAAPAAPPAQAVPQASRLVASPPVEMLGQPAPRSTAARGAGDDEPVPAEARKPGAQDSVGELPEKAGATMLIARRVADAPPRCTQCLGTGCVPILPGRAYTHFAKDVAPSPVEAVPWSYCPRCQANAVPATLLQTEAQRLRDDKARANQQNYEQASRLKFLRAETQHVTLYMQIAEPFQRDAAARTKDARASDSRRLEDRTHLELKEVAAALEQLKIQLEQSTRTTVLTQTRPDTHEMLILWDVPSYNIAIDGLLQQSNGDDKVLARKAAGVSGRYRAFYNSYLGEPTAPRPPKHMALFLFGHMLIREATDGKAPPWLIEGFSAYCEHAVTKQNLCYSFEYEMNEIRFGTNWDLDIRRFAREAKLKQWRQTFALDLIGAKPLDYLSFYSIVSFLMSDPPRFAQLAAEFKAGADSATALERSYGRKLEEVQAMWGNCLLR